MSVEETKTKIREFLARVFKNHNLKEDENIFELGVINSMFAMELVMFVEKEFKMKVEQEDLDFENFKSINALASLVRRRTANEN